MPWNVLLLPPLGGYRFYTRWNRTKHAAKRKGGRRVLIESAFSGVCFLGIAFLAGRAVDLCVPELTSLWNHVVPIQHSGISLSALLLAEGSWRLFNRWTHQEADEIKRAIRESDDYLEQLLEDALRNDDLVCLTTVRGKVYVGKVVGNFLPSGERDYFKLLPHVSGYRDAVTQTITVTTRYFHVYHRIASNPDQYGHIQEDDFGVVVPVSELHTINLFDPDAYALFQQSSPARANPS